MSPLSFFSFCLVTYHSYLDIVFVRYRYRTSLGIGFSYLVTIKVFADLLLHFILFSLNP
jgi:hypothetical protein